MEPPPVQYVTTSDGFDIAYTVCGEGMPYVFMPYVSNHVQMNWHTPYADWLEGLKDRFKLICYDSRGQGMSSRGLPSTFKLSDYRRDLGTVIEHLSLDRFVIDAMGYFGHVAAQYAVAHPERVEAMILKHCSLSASVASKVLQESARDDWDLFLTLISGILPGERAANLGFLQQATTQQDWLTFAKGIGVSEVAGILPDLHVPTLLLHARGFIGINQDEASKLAARIRSARLVLTEGSSIIIDAAQGLQAIDSFLEDLPLRAATAAPNGPHPGILSPREIEVLRLVAAGKSSREIGDELVLSVRTVERHIANIYLKTETHGRAQVAVYARERGLF